VLDRAVRRRFRDGDTDAVRQVYREYGRLVYSVALRVLGDRGLAEEATQQAFLKAWRAAASVDEDREMGPWLIAITRRVAIDVYRRESIRPASPLDDVPAGDPAVQAAPVSVDSLYATWEVRRALTELPADEQEVVRLQHFDALTHEEIAQRLEIAVGTVKSRSFRAHKRLASMLGHLQE
jgi:RNA polymerase sigma factor (sigma-70 family)